MRKILLVLVLLAVPRIAVAARPLATDDAGTVDPGHLEMELGFEYANDADNEYSWTSCIKYGIVERLDFGIELPYKYLDIADGNNVDGIGDIALMTKYRFWEENENRPAFSTSLSIKTETADEGKGLGSGELDYALNTILSKELGKVVSHLNLGYRYVGTPEGQSHDNLLTYGLAMEYPLNQRLTIVAELSGETVFAGGFDANLFAALIGFNYMLSERLAWDFGLAGQISEASPDYKLTSGITLSF